MNTRIARICRHGLLSTAVMLAVSLPAHAVDEAAARALHRDSKCTKCHDVDKNKDGPSYKEIAAEYKGKPEAAAKMAKHISEPHKVEVDGKKVDHGTVKTRDAAKIRNLVEWILAQ